MTIITRTGIGLVLERSVCLLTSQSSPAPALASHSDRALWGRAVLMPPVSPRGSSHGGLLGVCAASAPRSHSVVTCGHSCTNGEPTHTAGPAHSSLTYRLSPRCGRTLSQVSTAVCLLGSPASVAGSLKSRAPSET